MTRGWTFRLPREAPDGLLAEIGAASLIGKDGLPWPTDVAVDGDRLVVSRPTRGVHALQLPLTLPDFGRLLVQSCALPEEGDYRLLLEIARGEVDKARAELAECERKGLRPSLALRQTVEYAGARLAAAVFSPDGVVALDALRAALWCGETLVEEFGRCAAVSRKGKGERPVRLSCVFDDGFFEIENTAALRKLFDAVTIPIDWRSLELDTGERQWEALEHRVDWCLDRGLAVTVGPIVDLFALPGWFDGIQDPEAGQLLMIDLVETAVDRLHDRVTSWEVVSGAASSTRFDADDQAMMLLLMKAMEAVQSQDPQARLVLTVDHPWGDYLRSGDRRTGPLDFFDRVLRMDAPVASLCIEVKVGVEGGSQPRTPLDFRRLLEHYAELGPTLVVRLLCPAEQADDARPSIGQSAEDRQADWLETHVLAALGESAVERIEWGRLHDLPGMPGPSCGLFSQSREPRRALRRLRALRKACF